MRWLPERPTLKLDAARGERLARENEISEYRVKRAALEQQRPSVGRERALGICQAEAWG
jgi:hypothetical protein